MTKKIINNTITFCFLLLLLLFGTACDKQNTNPQDYLDYLAETDNGLQQNTCEKDFCYQLKFLPQEYFALRALDNAPSQEGLTKELKNIENSISFVLKIRGNNTQLMAKIKDLKKENWEQAMNELRFGLQKKLQLRLGEELKPCAMYNLEQTAFAQEELQFLITFDIESAKSKIAANDLVLEYNDELLSNKTIILKVENKNIQKIPNIKF